MDAERWQRIEEIFQTALDCEPTQRAALLDSACGDDRELRAEVESLLESHDQSSPTASSAFNDGMRLLEHHAERLREGERIGPYRVIREIGRGGMGSVFLAARADEAFQKLVAIKIIRRGLDTDDILRRFRSERQILAKLDHPNITRLLDAGSTDGGLPYFVMEYIDGEPIDQYCDGHKLNTTERLKLFQAVCAAVGYAHQNLVIHRDIKPGNILVTNEGVPRLLDFGIAKLLAAEPETIDSTLTIARRLTPEYASPEQLRGEPITTVSDVYSLGVLLYVLLTGRRPYHASTKNLEDLTNAVISEEPERPSAVVFRAENVQLTPESVSATREGTAERLRRRLQGDLDNIVLMALRKEPERRYASADRLSEDISRHLGNLPVIARRDTPGYRITKFVRRHAAGVSAAVLISVILIAGIATTLWQAHVARKERDHARLEQAKADRIKSFLTDMLSYSSPDYTSSNLNKNRDAKVSEVLDQAAKRAESELSDQPEVRAAVQSTIGGVYAEQGRYEQAEAMLRLARRETIQLYGHDSNETVEVSDALANALLENGKPTEADSLFREDIDTERKLEVKGQANPKDMAYVLAGYGSMLDQRNDRSADSYLREALKYTSGFTGKDRVFVAMIYNDLSNEAGYRGDSVERERYVRASLDEYNRLPPGVYVEKAVTLSNLGALLISKGRLSEAEPFVREGLQLRLKVFGNAHLGTAGAFNRLSDLLYRQGKYIEAEKAAQDAIDVYKRALQTPENNVLYSNPFLEMGLILDKLGNFRDAERSIRQALEIRSRLLSKGNLQITAAQQVLGEFLVTRKRYAEAEPLLVESYQSLQATTPVNDPRRNEATQHLFTLYSKWGKADKAARYQSTIHPGNAH